MITKDSQRNVYLYQRFSSVGQEGNSSLYRQGTAQREWLAAHPLCNVVELEDKPLIDSGFSAFYGKHLESGSLGRLVKAIEDNYVQKGSIILVEHFSRLSRMNQTETAKLLDKIWDKDITIVTARDRGVYSPEMRDDLATRMRLIVEIDKAHSDSKWRSDKAKGSWQDREKKARGAESIVPKMKMPFWLTKSGKLNEYAPVVVDIFKLHAEGYGQVLIERQLCSKYGEIPPLKNINPTKIIRIIKNEKCIGVVYGKKLYEPVVQDHVFYNAQKICSERLFTSVRPDRKWPLHGMIKCGHCGSGTSIQQTADYLPLIRCSRKRRSAGEKCDSPSTFPYIIAFHFFKLYVEPLILALMSNAEKNNKNELRCAQINQDLVRKKRQIKEAKLVYDERVNLGKSAKTTLNLMDELQEEIDLLQDEITGIKGKIGATSLFTSISKEMIELSSSDMKRYNLALNKTGYKITLHNRILSFGIENEETIATLEYLKYDRKSRAYLYNFHGIEKYFNKTEISSQVKTDDYSVENLLEPDNTKLSHNKWVAKTIKEMDLFSRSVKPFYVEN